MPAERLNRVDAKDGNAPKGSEEHCAGDSSAGVPTTELAIKIGRFASRERFEREVEIQSLCAKAGIAPRVLSSKWDSAPGKTGVIVMERLTQPSYFRWMIWLSKDLGRVTTLPDRDEYLIHPKVASVALVQKWAAEVRKLKTALAGLDVYHGDCHDQNIVFDVPQHRREIFSTEDKKARKRLLMRYIALGPGGPARLVFIDFGDSLRVTSFAGKLCLFACGAGEKFADPEFEHEELTDPESEVAHTKLDLPALLGLSSGPRAVEAPQSVNGQL